MKADLHVHTNISDSSDSIDVVIEKAKSNNLKYIGIVNHDTIEGLEKAIEKGKRAGLHIIPGVEISAYDYIRDRKVHLLGYNFNSGQNIKSLCDQTIEKRHQNSLRQIHILIDNGYNITLEEVMEKAKFSTCIYKQHIMDVLIDKGYTTEIYSDLYDELFKNDGICAGDIEYVDVFDALEAIKKDGGKAILAHPGQYNSYDIMKELYAKGLDGIELYHEEHKCEDLIKILEFSVTHPVILTGGSDTHSRYGETEIGDITVPINFIADLK